MMSMGCSQAKLRAVGSGAFCFAFCSPKGPLLLAIDVLIRRMFVEQISKGTETEELSGVAFRIWGEMNNGRSRRAPGAAYSKA